MRTSFLHSFHNMLSFLLIHFQVPNISEKKYSVQLSNGAHFFFTSIVQGTSFKVDIRITVATSLASEESPLELVQTQPKIT